MGKSTTKDRSKQIRIFDEDGFRKRADAIIFKDKLYAEVLLVSSRSEPEKWTVAGGGMEPGETAETTCVREAREEAGVVGSVDLFVGSFDDPERKTRTEVYIVMVEQMIDTWEDSDQIGRRRRWFSVADAIAQTARRPQKQRYLIAACDLAQLQRNPTTLRSHSGPLKQLPSPSTCYHRTPVLLLILTCALVFCVGVYMIVY